MTIPPVMVRPIGTGEVPREVRRMTPSLAVAASIVPVPRGPAMTTGKGTNP